ncbi:MAG: NAD+ synthase [Bryobacteraceae bacterium]|nr:NAD+ synthase [Bryobacteraceae bacterium]
MRIALAQIDTTVGDFAGNAAKILDMARRAAELSADVAVFPELALTGYPPLDLIEKPSFLERAEQALATLTRDLAGVRTSVVAGTIAPAERSAGKRLVNSAVVVERGAIVFRQDKMLLPTYDVFDEARYFQPADKQRLTGIAGRKTALTICEDAWNDKQFWERRLYQRDPVEELVSGGAEVLISINSSPYHIGKRAQRRDIFAAAARRYKIPVVYVNQVGGNDQLVFDGSSFALDARGNLAAAAKSFAEDLVTIDIDTGLGQKHETHADECEAVYEALVLGTRDYIRKCGFSKVLIGLSGGVDSSITAAIAVEAVGRENVTGVAMPGPYSSDHSLTDARALAENLGVRFEVAPIHEMYSAAVKNLSGLFAGAKPDTTEENIQSRLRGMTLMALSNKWGALVLTTGNKSEMAVGYCTLYGDMCGGLAVISDVPKTMVYELSRVANRRLSNAIPESVFTKPPSAELRPDQKDTDSLPEYEVLDAILKGYIEELRAPSDIAERLQLDPALVRDIVNKVDRNEYKRQQAAPGLKVTTKAFGIGRRFPIAQRFSE